MVQHVLDATDGAGVDVMLEMSGHPDAIHKGFQMLRPGGRASLLGIPKDPVTLDLVNDVIFKGATVQGIYGRRMFETWVQMTELLKHGRLEPGAAVQRANAAREIRRCVFTSRIRPGREDPFLSKRHCEVMRPHRSS